MALGAVGIALSSATEREHSSWQDAAEREGQRYGVEGEYVRAGMEGRAYETGSTRRSQLDWLLIAATTGLFVVLAAMAKFPHVAIGLSWALALVAAMFVLLVTCGIFLWRTTEFR